MESSIGLRRKKRKGKNNSAGLPCNDAAQSQSQRRNGVRSKGLTRKVISEYIVNCKRKKKKERYISRENPSDPSAFEEWEKGVFPRKVSARGAVSGVESLRAWTWHVTRWPQRLCAMRHRDHKWDNTGSHGYVVRSRFGSRCQFLASLCWNPLSYGWFRRAVTNISVQ